MRRRGSWSLLFVAILWLAGPLPRLAAQALEPIAYHLKFPAPDKHFADIEASVPTGGRDTIELMMPMWTPGYYRIENYAAKVQGLTAQTPSGKALKVEQPKKNRVVIHTGGAAKVLVSYRLLAEAKSVIGNWVGDDFLVLNGAAAFVTLVEEAKRPHDIKLELAPTWKRSISGLQPAPGGQADCYRAPDFDTLVDSPILAGKLDVRDFTVDGSKHLIATAGDLAAWDANRAAGDIEKIVQEHRRLWGFLPFKRYVFLIVLRAGYSGGLEHMNSTLITAAPTVLRNPAGSFSWNSLVSHEYFHAFNVKRLRPVELGPFDYEKEVRTSGLWVAEGVTTYYGELIVARAGLATSKEFLARLSSHIDQLQKSPGRLLQTLEQSSEQVWTNSFSGVGVDKKSVSYYVKGAVAAFLLDAKIRTLTRGGKSLDDAMKLAYEQYSGVRGFTAEQFRKCLSDVAGVDVKEYVAKLVASTQELDYTEALDWYGLRFAPAEGKQAKSWKLEIHPDCTPAQTARLQAWLQPAK
jgi:predicted metalloprotease with PDZ domain